MRFTIGGAAVALLLASMAPAGAQMSPAPPPMMMGTTNWTGFYLGREHRRRDRRFQLHFYTGPRSSYVPSGGFSLGGPVGGGTVGFNWELSNSWLLGVEGDFDGSGINGSKICGPGSVDVCGTSSKWLATARARVGWAPGAGNMLWYVTGGGAWGEIKTTASLPVGRSDSDSTREWLDRGWRRRIHALAAVER
jgi:outer membrane immunogenic protein